MEDKTKDIKPKATNHGEVNELDLCEIPIGLMDFYPRYSQLNNLNDDYKWIAK
jgi:hypothetical protein